MREYDLAKMQELLHDFYNLTDIKICIYDSTEHELAYYPEKLSPFCRTLREESAMDEKCLECDRRAFAASPTAIIFPNNTRNCFIVLLRITEELLHSFYPI